MVARLRRAPRWLNILPSISGKTGGIGPDLRCLGRHDSFQTQLFRDPWKRSHFLVSENAGDSHPSMLGSKLKSGRVWSGPLRIRPSQLTLGWEVTGYGVEDNVALYSPSLEWNHTTTPVWSGHNLIGSEWSGQIYE